MLPNETSNGLENAAEEGDGRSVVPGGSGARTVTAVRGRLVWFCDDPFLVGTGAAMRHEKDGLLICVDGRIAYSGPYQDGIGRVPEGVKVVDYRHCVITPGFVDSHVHYTQVGMVASYGEKLINWLDKFVYPEEMKYSDKKYAEEGAELFCKELLRNGTTTALVFTSTYPHSVDVLFDRAAKYGMRIAAGKVLMDRNAPEALLDRSVEEAMEQTRGLIDKWHNKAGTRNVYAVMPRFPLACTRDMLTEAGRLWEEYPSVLMHSHIAENADEVFEGRKLFPECRTYLDVLDDHGLLRAGTVLAHGVHLTLGELDTCHRTGAAIAHCPTSNLFLGSGLFRLRDATTPSRPVTVGLATDVGGGTSLSMLTTMNEAYKVGALDGNPIDAVRLFYLATLGSARAMRMDHQIGSLQRGHEADFVVLDPRATPLLEKRTRTGDGSIEDVLFALALLGDAEAVEATYVAGRRVHQRGRKEEKATWSDFPFAWSRYDWKSGSWIPDQVVATTRGWRLPAIDAFAGGLHCVYNDPTDLLHWTVFTKKDDRPGTWSKPESLGVRSHASVALAPYHDLLYCFYSRDGKICWKSRDDQMAKPWGPEREIPGLSSQQPPAVTAYNDDLHVLAVDGERRMHWNTYHSSTGAWSGWEPWKDGNGDIVKGGWPSIAAYAGRLYVVYSPGADADVRWTARDPGGEWWRHRDLEGTAGTGQPRIAHYNGLLYAIGSWWESGKYQEIWWAQQGVDVPEWTTPRSITQIRTGSFSGNGLTAYHGQLYTAYFTG
ncbi:guanine deaminase [Marinactinospora thermotolerans]|uniref:guanine deaminase n=1 Tax=Marinactinospora thermotolerans TaxID=531310 RepID=UPI003D922175